MIQKIYTDQIFQSIVKSWIKVNHNFVLKKDGDLSHEPGKSNIVGTQKESNSLKFYFNYHSLFNLFSIKICQQPVKQHLHKYPYQDNNILKKLIYKGWTHVSQHLINEKIANMPKKLGAIITGKRKMTGYLLQLQVFI